MAVGRVDILMYHSISDAPGPTNIAPQIFEDQMAAIAESGVPVVSMDTYLTARSGKSVLPPHAVIITFDDGFQDFADVAWPVMSRHGFPAINYLPTKHIGGFDSWESGAEPRRIMAWQTVRDLIADGASFGSHSETHPDLTKLTSVKLEQELAASRMELEDKLSRPIAHFAPPYGASDARVRAYVSANYATSVGTYLDHASHNSDLLDLPRIEMFYFRKISRWREFLTGVDRSYLRRRRMLRRLGKMRNRFG